MKKDSLYVRIAKVIEDQIISETLKPGDKLPSVRAVQHLYNVSMNTARQAYLVLESKSLIEASPRSGYFVSQASRRKRFIPATAKTPDTGGDPDDLIHKVFHSPDDKTIRQLSLGVPDNSLLPVAKLNKSVISAVRRLNDVGLYRAPIQGNTGLRRNIAKWSLVLEGRLSEADIIITSGTLNTIFNCLMALTKPGDTVAIERPVYPGMHQITRSLGLKAVEIPTHSVTGIDLDALKKVLPRLSACCIISNFSNPLGSLMPDEHKKELVRMFTNANIPLIEEDYGNLFFGTERPKPCKFFDEAGIVLWCGSVSVSLAPGYRIAWVAPGKYKSALIKQMQIQAVPAPSLYQEVMADFLEHGRYDHYLRTLRSKLSANCVRFQQAITAYFPSNTKISQPQGGFVLWLELDQKIDTAALFDLAIRQKVSFAPGRMFTQFNQYQNCMRLNFASEWTDELDADLKRLGQLVQGAL